MRMIAIDPDNVLTLRDDPSSQGSQDQHRTDITTRTLAVRAATIDEKARTVEVTMSTDAPVMVMDPMMWERIDEVLVTRGGKFPAQIPLLAAHDRWSLDSVLGSVRNIRQEGNVWIGRAFFAEGDAEADKVWNKVRQGHLTDVSIGYASRKFTDIPAGQKAVVDGVEYQAGPDRRLRITSEWDTKECSVVPIGADNKAKVRGEPKPAAKTQPAASSARELSMNPLLRKYLESLGLRADASEDQAKAFAAALGVTQRSIVDDIEAGKIKDDAALAARTAPKQPAAPASATPAPAGQTQTADQVRAEAARLERDRITAIRTAAGSDIPTDLVDRAISESWTTERAGSEFLNHIRSHRSGAVGNDVVVVGGDKTRQMAELVLAASLLGVGAERHAEGFSVAIIDGDPYQGVRSADAWRTATQQGRRYAGMGAKDFLRQALTQAGQRFSLADSPGTLLRAAVSGGAVTNIFTTSAYASMLMAWDEVADSTVGWVSEADVINFLTHTEIDYQQDAQLKKHTRGGTAQHSNVSDSGQTFKLARFSKQFSVDEMDIIDDRFGALLSAPAEHGKAARRLRPQLVYSLLNQNGTYGGGLLFNNTAITTAGGHANLGSTALGADGMKAAANLMAVQYLLQGKVRIPLNIVPETLVVPAALQWTAKELINSDTIIIAGTAGAITERGTKNVLANAVRRLVVDDSIGAIGTWDPSAEVVRAGSATNYYLASAPGRTIEVSYRRGTGRAPQLRSYVLDQGRWGIGWDINYDIEAHVKDFRGLVKGNA